MTQISLNLVLTCLKHLPDKYVPGSFGNTQVLSLVFVLASGVAAVAAAVAALSVVIDVLHHKALVDFDSDCLVAGDTVVVPCSAACVVLGLAVALGVLAFQGTAQAAAAVVVVAAAGGNHAGCLLLLAELDMLQIVALVGIPVAEGVLDRTAVIAIGEHQHHVEDKTGDVPGPGQKVAQGTHAEFLGYVVLNLVVVVVVVVVGVVEAVEMFVSDCHVVCTVDKLVAAAAHDMETAAVVAVDVVVAAVVIGDLEIPADFPVTLQFTDNKYI